MQIFKEISQYKEFLKSNVKKDIRGKYKGSFLGVLWSFVNPLLSVIIYAIVFHYIMRFNIDHYVIYLIAGVIPWTFFTTAVQTGMNSVLFNADIIKKVYFPRIILPISSVTSALVNFLISCIIIIIFVIFSGVGLSIYLIFLPVIAIIQYLFTLGIVFVLSGIEIYVRDIEHIINFIIGMFFYLTPILYTIDLVPEQFHFIIDINPMAHIINAYHNIFYYKTMPDMTDLTWMLALSGVILWLGYKAFDKLQRGFAEEV